VAYEERAVFFGMRYNLLALLQYELEETLSAS